jgi:signal peptidase I
MLKKLYNWANSWVGTIIIVLLVIFFGAQSFIIPSGSMKNTLLIGDMLFVKKFSYGVPTPTIPWLELKILPDFNNNGHLIEGDKPKRGDIVVFRYPHDDKIHFVKRAVAIGGDIVAIKNKKLLLHLNEGDEYIRKNYKKDEYISYDNRLWLVNPYRKEFPGIHNDPQITKYTSPHTNLFDMNPIIVPNGEFFMLGDNRDHSHDSRFWGTVAYRYVVGKPWFIYLSFDDDKSIRWNRVFRNIDKLQKEKNSIKPTKHKDGIY